MLLTTGVWDVNVKYRGCNHTDQVFRSDVSPAGPSRLVNDRRFRNRPMVLETPKEEPEEDDMDTVNLRVLRGLVQNRNK